MKTFKPRPPKRPRHTMRQIAATSRLVCTDTATRLLALILSLRSVAQIQTGLNSRFARCRHLTTTTRIPFVFALLFKF